ncbi:MAG: phosphodiester glycosidase family protein [Candidatus Sericytochromatia bacterium]|nr:phosphodiester glycosidase family protein [Candidatus Sericytochromatia bacterium]
MNEIPFSRLKPPSELFQLPARPAGGAVSLPLANPPAKPQPLSTPVSAPLPASDQTQLSPLKAARLTPAPVTLNDSPPAVSGSVATTKSAKSAPPVQASAGREIAPGIRLDSSRKSKDGAPIRVLTIDPARTQILPIVAPHGGPLDGDKLPQNKQGGKPLLAAINASFFTPQSVIGDVQALQLKLTDDAQPAMDKVTDQRYFLAVDKAGSLKTGKGGLSENPGAYQTFLGGFPALFTSEQMATLEADIRSGAFAKRASYGGASPETTISRSFVGVTAKGELLLVAAGEGRLRAQGVSIVEAARLLKSMGAREAYILDGGGSTSLYVKDTLYARTDGRQVHCYLGIYAR